METPYSNLKPLTQLFSLILMIAGGMILSILISSIIAAVSWGTPALSNPDVLMQNVSFLRASQIIQVFFMFFAPSLLFFRFFGNEADFTLFQKPNQAQLMVFSVLAILLCQPFIEWTALINQKLQLPDFLQPVSDWMAEQEDELSALTYKFLDTHHLPTILINIAMMVILPAFCEELLFRGVLQNKLAQWWKNGHVAIFFTAFVFSAIHMQFFTFLPRFILGIGLGYLLYFGKSLWLPVLGHLTNNSLALILFYYYQAYHPEVDPLAPDIEETRQPLVYVVSFVLFVSMIVLVKYWKDKKAKVIR